MKFDINDKIKHSGNDVFHESAGGFLFYEDKDSHQLSVALLRTEDNKLVIPKGHLKHDEDPENAATREIMEELSLSVKPILINKLGIDHYSFTLDDTGVIHHKDVHLFVYQLVNKESVSPGKDENLSSAEWVKFDEALNTITFDRDNLLKARQIFYFYKKVKAFKDIDDVKSLTVAIPTHNGAGTILNTILSLEQEFKKLPKHISIELIVCADHCTDDTFIKVKNLFSRHDENKSIKRILIENTGPKGKSSVLNTIYERSTGELFCVIDDDILLEENTILELIRSLIDNPNLCCVFAAWKRLALRGANPWRKFWHWILGVKFDIQPYDKKSEIMRGPCLMLRRENYIYLPCDEVFNEDQFIQYMYWPKTAEIQKAVIYFNSVSSITDYYRRFIRIMYGDMRLNKYFTKERIQECRKSLFRKLDYKKIFKLPWKYKAPFLLYRFVRYFVNLIVKIKLSSNESYEWFRIKQN